MCWLIANHCGIWCTLMNHAVYYSEQIAAPSSAEMRALPNSSPHVNHRHETAGTGTSMKDIATTIAGFVEWD